MTLLARRTLICDDENCFNQVWFNRESDAATVRRWFQRQGWTRVGKGREGKDFCPKHSAKRYQ